MEEKDEPKSIHTYQSDIQEAINKQSISSASVFAAEQEKKSEQMESPHIDKSDSKFSFNLRAIGLAILILIVAGSGLFYFLKTPSSNQSLTPSPTLNSEAEIISYDSYVPITLSENDNLYEKIDEQKTKFSNGVEVISFGLSSDKFLNRIDPNISGVFVRSLKPEFAFGFVGANNQTGNNKGFLVLKVDLFSDAKGSLLSTEHDLSKSFINIFNIPQTNNLTFKDAVIENHDTRKLIDSVGKTYFLYSFIDSKTLVFAEDDDTFKTIISRINSAKR